MKNIKSGKYRHYKGKFYKVLGIAKHSETNEDFVVYISLYDDQEFSNPFWVRPLEMFKEEVEVDGEMVPRFKFVG